jgi:uncharacterized protein (TIGR00299 family) protein
VKVAHFDCFSGISGDMTLGALIDAGVDADAIRQGIASLGLPIQLEIEKVRKGGFAATYVHVEAPQEDTHRFLPDVDEIIHRGSLSEQQRDLALRIFRRLAEAEATVHGMPLEQVHFHEVGALDSIADIAGAAVGLNLLGVERFTSRPVPTGSGMVQCAHGLMPIPAPGTAELLRGVPLARSDIKAELTTPTGAAVLTTVVSDWLDQPVMMVEKIGHGAGKRNFVEQPNILRLFVGQVANLPAQSGELDTCPTESDQVYVIETNLDDLQAEVIGYCYDLLFAAGALDVYTTPIHMKKNRPGMLLSVLAPETALAAIEEILFRETTTFGIRRYSVQRHKLNRRPWTVSTEWGPIQGKLGWRDGQPPVFSPEYEDCARVARQHGMALRAVYAAAERAFAATPTEPDARS